MFSGSLACSWSTTDWCLPFSANLAVILCSGLFSLTRSSFFRGKKYRNSIHSSPLPSPLRQWEWITPISILHHMVPQLLRVPAWAPPLLAEKADFQAQKGLYWWSGQSLKSSFSSTRAQQDVWWRHNDPQLQSSLCTASRVNIPQLDFRNQESH